MARSSNDYDVVNSGRIPGGWRLATCSETNTDIEAVKSLLSRPGREWHICRLADGQVHGPKRHFAVERLQVVDMKLGHMLIKRAPEFRIVENGSVPNGWRLATVHDVQSNLEDAKKKFGSGMTWHICKLGDGRMSGPGYNFDIQGDGLGHMMVIKK